MALSPKPLQLCNPIILPDAAKWGTMKTASDSGNRKCDDKPWQIIHSTNIYENLSILAILSATDI